MKSFKVTVLLGLLIVFLIVIILGVITILLLPSTRLDSSLTVHNGSLLNSTVSFNATNEVRCQKESNGDYLELQDLGPNVEINRVSHYDEKNRILKVSICADSVSLHQNPTCSVISTKLSECVYSKNLPALNYQSKCELEKNDDSVEVFVSERLLSGIIITKRSHYDERNNNFIEETCLKNVCKKKIPKCSTVRIDLTWLSHSIFMQMK